MIRNQQPVVRQRQRRRRRPPPRIQSTQEFSVTRKCFVQIPVQQVKILMQKQRVVGAGVGVEGSGGDDRNRNNSSNDDNNDDVLTEENNNNNNNNNDVVYWPGILVKDLGNFSNLIRQKMETLRQLKGDNNNDNNNNKEKEDEKYGIELEKEIFHAATSSSRSGIFLFGKIQFNTASTTTTTTTTTNSKTQDHNHHQQHQRPISYVVPYGVYPIDFCCSGSSGTGTGTGTDISKIWEKVDIVDGYVEALKESLEFWKLYSIRSSVGNDDKLLYNEVMENSNYEEDDVSIDSSSSSESSSSSSGDDNDYDDYDGAGCGDDDDADHIVSPSRSNLDETSSTTWVETQRKQDESNDIMKLSSNMPSSSTTMVVETPQKQIINNSSVEKSSSLMEQNLCGEQNNEIHNTATTTATGKEHGKEKYDSESDDTQNEQGGKKVIPIFLDDDAATTKQKQIETDTMKMIEEKEEEERRRVETKRNEAEKDATGKQIEAIKTKTTAADDEEKRKQIEAEQELQAEAAAATTTAHAKVNTDQQHQAREARPAAEEKLIADGVLKLTAVTGLIVKQAKQLIDAVDAEAKAKTNADEEETTQGMNATVGMASEPKKKNTTNAEAQEKKGRILAREILQNPDIEANAESKKNLNLETTNNDTLSFRVFPAPADSRPCINSINTLEEKTKPQAVSPFGRKMKINNNESQEHLLCKTRSRGGIGKILKINFPDKKLGLLIVDKLKTKSGMNFNDMPYGTDNGGAAIVSGFTGWDELSCHNKSYSKVNIGDELLSIGDTNVRKESLSKIVGLISTSSRPLQIRFLRRKNTTNNSDAKKKKTTDSTTENHDAKIIVKFKTSNQERSTAVPTSLSNKVNDGTTENPYIKATAKSKVSDQERGTAVPTSLSNKSNDGTTENPNTKATAKSKMSDQERGGPEKNQSITVVPTSSPKESHDDTMEIANTKATAKSKTLDQVRGGAEKNQSSTAVPTSSPKESHDDTTKNPSTEVAGKQPKLQPKLAEAMARLDMGVSENAMVGKNMEKSAAKKPRAKKKIINPFLDPLLFNNRSIALTKQPCKCGSSRCLKLYCECFHTGAFCDPSLCNCKDCHNTSAHNQLEEPRGPRVVATLKLLNKNPEAFSGGGRKVNTKGCRCQKSRCLKKFCECVASGKRCTESCLCKDCQNTPQKADDRQESPEEKQGSLLLNGDQKREGAGKNQSSTIVPTLSPNEVKDEDNVEPDCMVNTKIQCNEETGYWYVERRNEYRSQNRCHLHKKGKCLNCDCCWKCDPPPFCSKYLHIGKTEFCSKDLHIGKKDARNIQRKRFRSSSSLVGSGGALYKKSKGSNDKVQGSVSERLSKTAAPDKTKLEPKTDCNDGEDWLYRICRYQVIKKIPTFAEVKETLEEGGHSFRDGLFTVPLDRGKVEVFSSENAYREYLCRNGVTLKGVSDRDASRERKYMILAAWVCYQRVEKLLGDSVVPIYYTGVDIHSDWKQTLAKLGFHRSSTGRWTVPGNKGKIEDFGLTHLLAQEGIPEYLVQECNMTRDDHILLELHSSCPFRRLIHYPFFQKIN